MFSDELATLPRDTVSAVRLERVTKIYGRGGGAVTALDDVTIGFASGTFTAVMGPSGSGKSTFLHCAAGLDRPTRGNVFLGETDLSRLSETRLTELRRQQIGFVFQAFNLVSSLDAEQNITLPFRLSGDRPNTAWVSEVIERTGLSGRVRHRPAELSGGQQQRVALARALVTRPQVVFADEPTGALDSRTSREILELLRETVDSFEQTVVMVTHDPVAASFADRVIFLSDGAFAGKLDHPSAATIAAQLTQMER